MSTVLKRGRWIVWHATLQKRSARIHSCIDQMNGAAHEQRARSYGVAKPISPGTSGKDRWMEINETSLVLFDDPTNEQASVEAYEHINSITPRQVKQCAGEFGPTEVRDNYNCVAEFSRSLHSSAFMI
jgi:hypothetical protein